MLSKTKREERLKNYFLTARNFRELCFLKKLSMGSEFDLKLSKVKREYTDLYIEWLEFDWFTYALAGNIDLERGKKNLSANTFISLGEELSLGGKLYLLWRDFNFKLKDNTFQTFSEKWIELGFSLKISILCTYFESNCDDCLTSRSFFWGITGRTYKYDEYLLPINNQKYNLLYLIGHDQFVKNTKDT
jgi:hypothetical protein